MAGIVAMLLSRCVCMIAGVINANQVIVVRMVSQLKIFVTVPIIVTFFHCKIAKNGEVGTYQMNLFPKSLFHVKRMSLKRQLVNIWPFLN